MEFRVGTPFGHDGSSKAEWGTLWALVRSESLVLKMIASSRSMSEKYTQRWRGLNFTSQLSNDHSGPSVTSKTESDSTRSSMPKDRASQRVSGMSWGGGEK